MIPSSRPLKRPRALNPIDFPQLPERSAPLVEGQLLAFRPGGFGAEVVEGEQGRDLLARHRRTSVNKLIEEIAIIGIAEFDAETRFSTLAAKGSVQEGLALLDRAFEEVGREGEGAGK